MRRILVIEDDMMFAPLLEALLEEAGFSPSIKGSASEGLAEVNDIASYNGAILDLMMPREGALLVETGANDATSGEIIFHAIRKRNQAMPIVVVTAKEENEVPGTIKADVHCLLVLKPVDDDDIARIVRFLS